MHKNTKISSSRASMDLELSSCGEEVGVWHFAVKQEM